MISKKGISPLIATVLLIGFTIVLAALVFQWGSRLFNDITTTTGCESQGRITCTSNMRITLGDVEFNTDTNAVNMLIINNGVSSKPINSIKVQVEKNNGEVQTKTIDLTSSPLNAGDSRDLVTGNQVLLTYNSIGTSIKAIHIVPGFMQLQSDGSTCQINCEEQKTSVLSPTLGGRLRLISNTP